MPDVIIHHEDHWSYPWKRSIVGFEIIHDRMWKTAYARLSQVQWTFGTQGRGIFYLSVDVREKIFTDMTKEFGHLEGENTVAKNHGSRVITLMEKLYKPIITLKPVGTDAATGNERLDSWFSSLPNIWASPSPLFEGKSSLNGSRCVTNMISTYSLRMSAHHRNDHWMNTPTGYFEGMAYRNGQILPVDWERQSNRVRLRCNILKIQEPLRKLKRWN